MSTLKVLKEYLVGDGGYLLNDDNNGKTVMLSGAWGSGKTHFWQNEIVREQIKIQGKTRKVNKYSSKEYKAGLFSILQKKKKACVCISLYGKDNIEDIKSQVFAQAYAQIPKKGNKDKNIDKSLEWLGYGSKIASAVSIFGVKIDTTEIIDKGKDYQDSEKLRQAQEMIKDGGVICFDDFERKSKHIDLNDLFGVITQLSLEFNCKVVIILNSEVFKGEDANVFKNVKEKTVNKYFHFEPSPKELFDSIAKDKKYNKLNDHKEEILKAIEETEELNARIYIQVLDNCLEWIMKNYSSKELQNLTYITTFFIKYNYTMEYELDQYENRVFDLINSFEHQIVKNIFSSLLPQAHRDFNNRNKIIPYFRGTLCDRKDITEEEAIYLTKIFEDNKKMFTDLWSYGFKLKKYDSNSNLVNNFVKSGILLKNNENIE